MTVNLVGVTHTGAVVLGEGRPDMFKVRCACGFEFVKSRVGVLQARQKGHFLRCWKCKRAAQSEHAKRQAEARKCAH